jgi:CRP/FNR family transcriptional regulator, cyclic AMP receptor protein
VVRTANVRWAIMATPSGVDPLVREALLACRLFAGLDESGIALVAGALRTRRFRRGEVIFHAGDPGDSLSIVSDGSIKILVASEDGAEPAILTTLGPGGFFGELALLDGGPRSATAVAVGPTETLVLRRDAFDRLLDGNAAIRRALLTALAGEVRRLTAQLADLHFLDLPGRLARHLLRKIEATHGPISDGEVRLSWPFTQGELAGMIGGSRQSVNRLLADFVGQGLLRFEGDELVIPDPRRLAQAAAR